MRENASTPELFSSFDATTLELLELMSFFSDTQINELPFTGSWTAAQVADHVTRSNIGIIRSLKKEGRISSGDPQEGIEQMKNVFLNFETKLQSPDFILPTQDIYEREPVINSLSRSIEQLRETAADTDLLQTIDHSIFGEVTKVELLHFAIYHTQRHIRQLKNIFIATSVRMRSKMRNLVAFMHVSLDGFVAGTCREMNWITMDDEIFEDTMSLAGGADTVLYGRASYQMMESYWPTVLNSSTSTLSELRHAQWLENINKIVFSTTLENAKWKNTRLIQKNIPGEIVKLKQQPGKNLMIMGSPRLAHSFMQWDLIDEYRININPVVLGDGIPLFSVPARVNLKLIATKNFKSGVVGLHYTTIK